MARASSLGPVPGSPYGSDDETARTVRSSNSDTPSHVWEMSVKARPYRESDRPTGSGGISGSFPVK
jgi:hypothetical protein